MVRKISLWPREQALGSQMNEARASLQVNFDLGQDFLVWKQSDRLVCQPCDYTSANEKDEYKRKVQRCLFANRLSFHELFDDISLVLNVRRLCVVVDSLISAAKVCDCVISAWCWQARYVIAWLSCFAKIFCASHKNVFSVFRLPDFTLEKQLSTQENWI